MQLIGVHVASYPSLPELQVCCMDHCSSLSHFHTVVMSVCVLNLCCNHALYMCLTPCPPCRVWDMQTGQVINDLLHHKGIVKSLKFTTDTLVTGSDVSG